MGQTLTHGIYLPDEGERNCYDGLAANWQLLDGAVGTVAEHTSQIAGKAPAVHTHSKSDITDLFNSANTWSALNTYTTAPKIHGYSTIINTYIEQGTIPQSVQYNGIWFGDKNSNLIGSLDYSYGTTGSTSFEIRLARNNANANRELLFSMVLPQSGNGNIILAGDVTPKVNNSYDLGSSSYQWNNLYAKNYYYNGTAWGLDKANVWTNTNTFQQNITYERTNFFHQAVNPCYYLKDTGLEKGNLASTHAAYPGLWQDKNNNPLGYVRFVEYSSGRQTAEIRVSNLIKNGALDPTGSEVNCTVNLELQPSGEKSLIPELNNDINLGTSTNKWKSLNGVNPGALSLPDKDNRVDITSEFTDLTGGSVYYIPPADGWINITADDEIYCAVVSSTHNTTFWRQSASATSISKACVTIPVRYTQHFLAKIKSTSAITATFYPCLGNV